MNRKLTISLVSFLIVIGLILIFVMVFSNQKNTYYGYMNSSNNAEKIVSEKDGLVTNNVKLKTENDFKPQKGDFVKLVSKDEGRSFYKKDLVNHDKIPHGLMMKIHEMDI